MQRYRFSILLAALLALMVFAPLASMIRDDAFPILSPLTTMLLFSAMLLSAVYAVARHRWTVVLFGSTLAVDIAVQVVGLFVEHGALLVLQYLLGAGIIVSVLALLLRFLFSQQRVTSEVIAASLCGYLLLGVCWAYGFSLLEWAEPESFSFAASVFDAAGDAPVSLGFGTDRTAAALYFSFVTLTTLGYGDIAPATTPARMLCAVEAITGQLYLAVLVARLVGLHIAHQSRREPPS